MIKDCDAIIFIGGGNGTMDEYKLAQRENKFCIAVGTIGGTAEKVLEEISPNS